MKKIIVSIFILLLSVQTISAQTIVPRTTSSPLNSIRTTSPGNSAGNLQTRSLAEIDRRIAALSNLLTGIQDLKFVSDTEKTTLSQAIETEITSLQALKTKITTQTDQTLLKEDIKSIVTSHRTFAFFLPQIRILAAADALTTAGNLLFDYTEKLQIRIDQAEAAGNNVAALESKLTNMKSQITTAQTTATNILASTSSLTVDGYPGNKSALQTSIRNIGTAAKNLRNALQTGNQIKTELAKMQGATSPSSSSATPTITTPVTP